MKAFQMYKFTELLSKQYFKHFLNIFNVGNQSNYNLQIHRLKL